MKSVLEVDQEGENLTAESNDGKGSSFDTKEKAEEDTFQALNLTPPTKQQTAFLKSNFGHPAFKPLQWKIIK